MNWQQLTMFGPQIFPVTLLFAGSVIFLTGLVLRDSFSQKLFWGILTLSAVVAVPFVALQAQSADPPSVSPLILAVWRFRLLFVDSLSLLWLPLSTLLLMVFLGWPQKPGTFPTTFRREVQCGLLLTAAVQWMALSSDAWIQWGLASFSGWMLALTLAREAADSGRGKSAVVCLVWFTVADFLWLLGLTWVSLVLPVSDLGVLSDPSVVEHLADGQKAVCVSGLSLLSGGLLLRCGLYPLMSWVSPAVRSCRDGAWLIGFGLGTGTILLLRWAPLLVALPESRWLLAGLGGLSSLVLGIIAWGQVQTSVRLTCAAGSQLSLVWLGLGMEPGLMMDWIAFALALIWLQSLIVLTLTDRRTGPLDSTVARLVLFLLISLTCLGGLGQEQVFSAIYRSPELPAPNRWLFLGAGMWSLLLTSRLMFGELMRNGQAPDANGEVLAVRPDTVSKVGWLAVVVLTALVLTGLYWGGDWTELIGKVQLRRPDIGLLLALIGLIAAWTWPEVQGTLRTQGGDRWESLRRLARAEFYVPATINLLLLLPIRAGAQISRFLEWIVFGNLTMQLPVNLLKGIARSARETDEDSDESSRMWQMVHAVAVMLTGVAIGMLL